MGITDDIIIATIGFIASLLVAVFSFLSSKNTVNAELKRLETTWNHNEKQQYVKEFAEMLTSVKFFVDSRNMTEHKTAVEKINLIRVKSNGEIAVLIDNLYAELAVASITNVDWWKVERLLASLVDAIRKKENNSAS